MSKALDEIQIAEETAHRPRISSQKIEAMGMHVEADEWGHHDGPGPEVSSVEISRGSTQSRHQIHRGKNGKRTTQEIFDALYHALSDANGERLSVSQIAEKCGMAYETAFWSLKLAEEISENWPLETIAYKRKRFYRFRRATRRNRRERLPLSEETPK